MKRLARISDALDKATGTESKHGYWGGPDLPDQRWLRDQLYATLKAFNPARTERTVIPCRTCKRRKWAYMVDATGQCGDCRVAAIRKARKAS